MAIASEDKVIDELEIRDTSEHISNVSENRGFIPKTIIVHNHLNQFVNVQLQGDIDDSFNSPIDIGSEMAIAANVDDYATLTDYFPFYRLVVSCGTAPTSGDLSIYLAKVSN